MTDNFKEIGSLFGREGSGAGFVKQTDAPGKDDQNIE